MPTDGYRHEATELDEQLDRRDISAVSLSIRAETIDEESRSIEAVLATENPVPVFDMQRFEVVDEVLLMGGRREVEDVPLLNDHRRRSLDDVFGSIRNIRESGSELICRMYFADMSELADDPEARRIERAWIKTKQKHQRNISVGYRIFNAVTIEPNKTRIVNARSFTAGARALRVVTDWIPREGSLTVINADAKAKTRKEEFGEMKKKLRHYLIKLGLRKTATEQEAWDYYHDLDDGQRAEAEQLLEGARPLARSAIDDDDGSDPTPSTPDAGQRNATPESQPVPPQLTAAQAIAQERERVSSIRTVFGDDEPELMTRAIDEGWTPEQAAAELLPAIRRRQATPVDNSGGHIGIHSRGNSDCTIEALQGAMYLAHAQPTGQRSSVSLDDQAFRTQAAMAMRLPSWLRADVNSDEFQRNAELAHQFSAMSMIDVCRHALALNNVRDIPNDYQELAQRAISSGSLDPVFTTSMNARVLSSYMDTMDTTMGWTSEDRNIANFKTNERTTMGKHGKLTRHARGGAPDHDNLEAKKEEYRIGRYSKKFILDEQDIIDDTFGALNEFSPEDMGAAARQLRPDLVYSILLANANLNATGAALFTSGQNNLFTGGGSALGIGTLETAVSNMGDQRIRDRAINLQARYLVVPPALQFYASRILGSPEVRDGGASDRYGLSNPIANSNISLVVDTRISAAGVVDPVDETSRSGSATNWFVTARPGENGAKTIEVGYLRGTGAAPRISPFRSDGENGWYLGWSIKMDIGAKALDYRGMQKHNGA